MPPKIALIPTAHMQMHAGNKNSHPGLVDLSQSKHEQAITWHACKTPLLSSTPASLIHPPLPNTMPPKIALIPTACMQMCAGSKNSHPGLVDLSPSKLDAKKTDMPTAVYPPIRAAEEARTLQHVVVMEALNAICMIWHLASSRVSKT